MRIRPLHDWMVIKRLNAEEKTAGGIIIPESAQDKPSEGVVMAIGPGAYKIIRGKMKFFPTTLNPGQRVVYPEHAATEVEIQGEAITLVKEEDVLGTYEENQLAAKRSFAVETTTGRPSAIQVMGENPLAASLREGAKDVKKAKKAKGLAKTSSSAPKKKSKTVKTAKKKAGKAPKKTKVNKNNKAKGKAKK